MVYFLRMGMKLNISQVQKQILAPSMQQSIEILLLPLLDLSQSIEAEMQNNPLLEIDEEKQRESSKDEDQADNSLDNMINQIVENSEAPYYHKEIYEEPPDEKPYKRQETLEEKLSRQLHIDLNDPLHEKIGEFIIGNINEDGYLTLSCEEIAEILGLQDTTEVEFVLKIIQDFDPVGMAARDLKECLLLQIPHKLNSKIELATIMVRDYLQELGQKKYQYMARKLKVSLDEIKETARLIASLDPRPARNYRPIRGSIYIKPDVSVVKDENDRYVINVNHDGLPPLRINHKYKSLIRGGKLSTEEKKFVKEQLQNAIIFIKSIEQRGQTIHAIAEHILKTQENFFNNGHSGLVPMTLKDVALAVNRNESTISRAINNKYMETPKGIYAFKFFFSQAVSQNQNAGPQEEGSGVSNRSVKEKIKELIEHEDKSSPLSDADIQKYFTRKGMNIARRTIAKYRQKERILPSHLRKI